MVKADRGLKTILEHESFVEKRQQKTGVSSDALGGNPYVDKMNTQMLFMEEVFETRKQKQMKRPKIKDQVFSYLQRCKAGESFLLGLHQE